MTRRISLTEDADVHGDHLVLWGRVVGVVTVVWWEKRIDKYYTIYCLVSLADMENYNVNVTVALEPQAHL